MPRSGPTWGPTEGQPSGAVIGRLALVKGSTANLKSGAAGFRQSDLRQTKNESPHTLSDPSTRNGPTADFAPASRAPPLCKHSRSRRGAQRWSGTPKPLASGHKRIPRRIMRKRSTGGAEPRRRSWSKASAPGGADGLGRRLIVRGRAEGASLLSAGQSHGFKVGLVKANDRWNADSTVPRAVA